MNNTTGSFEFKEQFNKDLRDDKSLNTLCRWSLSQNSIGANN